MINYLNIIIIIILFTYENCVIEKFNVRNLVIVKVK